MSREDAAPIFAALGDPTRLEVLARLCTGGPRSITYLAEGTHVTRQAVTKHLRTLSHAGLVRSHRVGRERVWELETKRLQAAHTYLNRISGQWDRALGRLKTFVEE